MEPRLVTVVAIDDDKGSLDFIRAALKQQPVEILAYTDADIRAEDGPGATPANCTAGSDDAAHERSGSSGPNCRGGS